MQYRNDRGKTVCAIAALGAGFMTAMVRRSATTAPSLGERMHPRGHVNSILFNPVLIATRSVFRDTRARILGSMAIRSRLGKNGRSWRF